MPDRGCLGIDIDDIGGIPIVPRRDAEAQGERRALGQCRDLHAAS